MQTDMNKLYKNCTLCPRACGVDRTAGEKGFCGETDEIRLAFAGLHMGEEPVISGSAGSGTVFFTGCTLGCSFCQNIQISRQGMGSAVSVDELAEIFIRLEMEGAHNINLVTGTHFIPSIAAAAEKAKEQGLKIPIVWNTSGFETEEGVELIASFADIFLTDLKTVSRKVSKLWTGTDLYPEAALKAAVKMSSLKKNRMEGELLKEGVIVRHLSMPGFREDSKKALISIKNELYPEAIPALMFQYIPPEYRNGGEGGGVMTRDEYEEMLDFIFELGLDEGFVQEYDPGDEWFPDFSLENPFSSKLARTVWSWRK
jgi:putative pyruvate formate lyase activating enzyme